jgi:hypothetical protein
MGWSETTDDISDGKCGVMLWDGQSKGTGERIEGTFKQATSTGAVIDVGGQPITIPLEKVRAIYFGAVPSASPTAPPPARDALDALRGLQSVVESGLTYRDYATRVLDAKVKVDRYLSSSPNDPPKLRKAIDIAMRENELAGLSWGFQGDESAYRSLITPDLLERCPAVAKIIEDGERLKLALAMGGLGMRDEAMGKMKVDGQYAHEVLWKCAITQGTEAERLLAHR